MNAQQLRNSILQEAIEGRLVPPACRQAGKTLTMNPQTYIKGQSCWFTYVIECEDGSFYKGFTDNLLRRYKQHCDGIGAEHTKRHKPKQLYYWEMHYSQEEALAREKYLKSGSGREWFQREVVEKADNWEPASVLLAKIRKEKEQLVKEGKLKKKDLIETPISEDEIPFDIPDSWEWVRLGYLINLLSGRDLSPTEYNKSNNGIPYMTGASNFESGILIVNRWTNHPATISHKGDLLITCKGTIGEMAFNTIGDLHVARQIMAINSHSLNLNYVRFFLMRIVSELENKAKSIIPGISRDDILNASFPLPPLAEQHRIVAKIEELFAEIDKLK